MLSKSENKKTIHHLGDSYVYFIQYQYRNLVAARSNHLNSTDNVCQFATRIFTLAGNRYFVLLHVGVL